MIRCRGLLVVLMHGACLGQSWNPQPSPVKESLRGISAAGDGIVWISGTHGTCLRTVDGGSTWAVIHVPGTEKLDVHAVGAETAYLLSIGEGSSSRVYKTADSGTTWKLQLTSPDAKGFFDQMAFWDSKRGVLMGDPVDGAFVVYITTDGGDTWVRRKLPPANSGEGAFAASGSGIQVAGTSEVWFGTGGTGGARAFYSNDAGVTWSVASTPLRNDGPGAGIFSLAFQGKRGIAVGGDYSKPDEAAGNVAITEDGGLTWTKPSGAAPSGFRSAVVFVPGSRCWLAVGTSGSDLSCDDGNSWKKFDGGSFHTLAVQGTIVWAAGTAGRIAKLDP